MSNTKGKQPVNDDKTTVEDSTSGVGTGQEQEEDSNKEFIKLEPGNFPKTVDEIAKITKAGKSPFFYYGQSMVCMVGGSEGVELRQAVALDVIDYAMRKVDFKDKKGNKKNLPTTYANALINRHSLHEIPAARELKGIIHAPTLRLGSCTLLSEPGYDAETKLFFDNTKGLVYPKSLPDLTIKEAQKALKKLNVVLKDFAFSEEVDLSVAMSIMIGTLLRKQLDAAPALAITAADVNAGKSYLADVIALFGTGLPAEPISFSGNKDEDPKVMLSSLIEGKPVISFDNIDRQLQSASISTTLTQKAYKGRIISTSKMPKAPTNVTVIFNGVNLSVNKDIARRALPCVLDVVNKTFEQDASKYVIDHRPELVMAALTIIATYRKEGSPGHDALPRFANYGTWSEWVRGPLVWLGMKDPCDRLNWWATFDYEDQQLGAVLHELYDFYSKHEDNEQILNVKKLRKDYSDNTEALQSLAGVAAQGGSNLNPNKLGIWLSKKLGTVRSGLKLIAVGEYQHATQYKVVKIDGAVVSETKNVKDIENTEMNEAIAA